MGRRDATTRVSGSSSPAHPPLQSGRHPYWGLRAAPPHGASAGGRVGGEKEKPLQKKKCHIQRVSSPGHTGLGTEGEVGP